MTTTVPANHIECDTCHQPVRRGDAVIRTRAFQQVGFHPACFTIHRAVKDIPVDVMVDEVVGGSLLERMARAGLR